MEKKMTAMEELIGRLRVIMEDLPSGSNRALGLATAMDLASYLKQMEREQIEEAWKIADNDGYDYSDEGTIYYKSASDYYTQNYGQ